MRAIELLYWLLGSIQAGQVSSIKRGTMLCNIILAHIELVAKLNEYRDERTSLSIDLVAQIKGILTFTDLDETKNLEEVILKVIGADSTKPKFATAYYLQGAFELADIGYIRINDKQLSSFPDCDLLQKLEFLFKISGDSYIGVDMVHNLKEYVANIFVHVIDNSYGTKSQELIEVHESMYDQYDDDSRDVYKC
jgi:hypothetical protein